MEPLSAVEGRVVASLVEKQLLTPQAYPLTLHALTAACNQSTSRDPVMALVDTDVERALESLKSWRLVRFVLPSHGRSVLRYRHVLDEAFGIDASQLAVLAVLELRGPQTAGELRARTERMAPVGSLEHDLALLGDSTPPLVARIGRGPGQKEERWRSLLGGDVSVEGGVGPAVARAGDETSRLVPGPATGRVEVDALRGEVAALRVEVDALRGEVAALRGEVAALRGEVAALRTVQ